MTEDVAEVHDDPPTHDMTGDEWRQAREKKYAQIREEVEARVKEGMSLPEFFIWLAEMLETEMTQDEGFFAEYVDQMDIWESKAQREEFRDNTFWFCYGPGTAKR